MVGFLLCSSLPLIAFANTIEVPEDELTRESVLPVFEKSDVVLNRSVTLGRKFELGAGLGFALNEPFYNPMNFQALGTYYFSDLHGVHVVGSFFMDGLSSYGEQLKRGEGLGGPANGFDPSKAPSPKYMVLGNYQLNVFYGKISLSKQTVMNLTLFGVAGVGVFNFEDVNAVAFNFGFGQNFYISKNFALRMDFRGLIFDGPDPTSKSLRPVDNPSSGSFKKRLYFNTQAALSAVFQL